MRTAVTVVEEEFYPYHSIVARDHTRTGDYNVFLEEDLLDRYEAALDAFMEMNGELTEALKKARDAQWAKAAIHHEGQETP